jgi:hypothetical protein
MLFKLAWEELKLTAGGRSEFIGMRIFSKFGDRQALTPQ